MNVRQILPASVGLAALLALGCAPAAAQLTAALEGDSRAILKPALADAAAGDAPPTATIVDNPFRTIPLESLTATRERPLFSTSRRPSPASPVAPGPVPSAPAQALAPAAPSDQGPPLALIGTITGGERPMALLFNKLTRAVSTTHEGDDALGWRLKTVSPRSAVIEKDGVSVTLALPKPGDPVLDPAPPTDAPQKTN